MHKRILPMLLIACLALAMIACGGSQEGTSARADITPMEPGTYTRTVEGMYDGMVVEVSITETGIADITVLEHSETEGISNLALEEIPQRIVDAQSVAVDTISGATATSNGIITAVREAIAEAGGNVQEFELVDTSQVASASGERRSFASGAVPEEWDMSYDIVVVGGGFAGLAATHTAAENGADTLLVEKMPFVGGNSQINGGVYASYTSQVAGELQSRLDLPSDTAEKHIEDTIVGGDYMSDEALVRNFVYGAPYYLDLLLDNGLELRETLTRPGGHYGFRTYTMLSGSGTDIVQVQKRIVDATDATIMVNTEMTQIYRESDGRVVGIRVQTAEGVQNIEATQAVILATGGFSGNVEMRARYVPSLDANIPTTNHVGATGEGIKLAEEIGAETLHMSYIQLYPFSNPDNGVLDPYAVIPFSGPSSGIVYVDKDGNRYVNEGERRDVCARAAQDTGGPTTFSIMGEQIVREGGFISDTQLRSGIEAGRIYVADTLEELVTIMNDRTYQGVSIDMSAENLIRTIETHNQYVTRGEDPDFGKVIDSAMMTIEYGPYYAIPQWPSVHHTMGGLKITPKTEVQDIWGNTIPGLFAAGEIVGGIHGTNRLGSNAVVDCVSHGVIAGQYAATGTLPEFFPPENMDL